jgi:CheY-like chemotaxis protein
MPPYRILIVDDHPDIRNLLRFAIATLGSEFNVVTVPSGEEALLEIRIQSIDLLVSDILLPGISGLELMKKAKLRYPDLKVILITGVVDRQIRREIAEAGADAYFLKPMDTADFLDAVALCLDLGKSKKKEPDSLVKEKSEENLSDRLSRLRQELGAVSTVLLDDLGNILAQAGHMPDPIGESTLFPTLLASLSAGVKVAKFLQGNPPRDLMLFSGPQNDIILSHVVESVALLQVLNSIDQDHDLSQIIQTTFRGVRDLQEILLNLGVGTEVEEPPIFEEVELAEEDLEGEAPLIDALLQGMDTNPPKTEEVDAFWDSITGNETSNGIQNADGLSYDQALQLGLAPDQGKD